MEAGRSRFRWRVATAAAVLLVALAIWILRWLPSSSLSSQAAEDAAVKLREDNAASLSSNQDRIQPAEAISCIDTEGQMAIDTFYLTSAGKKLNPDHQRRAEKALIEELRGE